MAFAGHMYGPVESSYKLTTVHKRGAPSLIGHHNFTIKTGVCTDDIDVMFSSTYPGTYLVTLLTRPS